MKLTRGEFLFSRNAQVVTHMPNRRFDPLNLSGNLVTQE
eukprot:COSAG02_NODE_2371_length_9032_cov_26.076122_2_plen_39_part_00